MSSLHSNPFATRFVSPGQVEWVGPQDYFEQLTARWIALNGRATIVGVHGTGKSTLLEHFVPKVSDVIWRRDAEGLVVIDERTCNSRDKVLHTGRMQTVWLQLRRTASQSMKIPWDELERGRLLLLDGYEQLNRWRRTALIARTQLRGVKLLITSHRRTVLPALCELSISAVTARHIVSQLTNRRGAFSRISEHEIQSRLKVHKGNMRDLLMDFYDRYEECHAQGTRSVKSKS